MASNRLGYSLNTLKSFGMPRILLGWFFVLILFSANCVPLSALQSDEKLDFTILHTNDEHSHLIPHPVVDDHPEFTDRAKGGIAGVAGEIDRIRQQKQQTGEPVVLLSAGDFLGGPAFGWLPLKEGVSAEMNLFRRMGYDAVTIGNHEFDYGTDLLADYFASAGFPELSQEMSLLSANIVPPNDHPLADIGIQKTTMITLENGLKVGLFGLMGNDAIRKSARKGEVKFLDPIESAHQAVDSLHANGAEVIVALTHSGVREDRQLARNVQGIHLIVGGHSHTELNEPVWVDDTVIVQAGQYFEHLGRIELSWDRDAKQLIVRNEENQKPYLIPVSDESEINPEIEGMVNQYEELLNDWVETLTNGRVETVRQVIAESEFNLTRAARSEATIGNFITDAMKFSAEERMGADVHAAVQANGAIRAEIVTGRESWSEGRISFYDMMMAASLGSGDDGRPGYPLVSFYLTGDEVIRALELSVLLSELLDNSYFLQLSGLKVSYDPERAILFRIPFSGTPVPSRRAVLNAHIETAEGRWKKLNRGDDELYHFVTDRYIAEFLPEVGNLLPGFTITLKDETGEAISLDSAVVMTEQGELKVWEALLDYTYSLKKEQNEIAVLPVEYSDVQGRIAFRNAAPIWLWPITIFAGVILILTIGWVHYRRSRKKAKQ
jgi:2',3'-cyclic-nucleotide 2'-phosphodiesterase (5'-nucleotidase family)